MVLVILKSSSTLFLLILVSARTENSCVTNVQLAQKTSTSVTVSAMIMTRGVISKWIVGMVATNSTAVCLNYI